MLDAHGKVAWGRGDIGGDPLLVVLAEAVPHSHLAGLRAEGVSYMFAGEREIDLPAALGDELGLRRVLLEGGGAANGAILAAGLVDELSLVLAPSVDGTPGSASVFDMAGGPGALIVTTCYGHTQTVEMLLGLGATVGLANTYGDTALSYARYARELTQILERAQEAHNQPLGG